MHGLTHLNIYGYHASFAEFHYISSLTDLVSLNIGGTSFSANEMNHLSSLVNLTALNLNDIKISISKLPALPQLSILQIYNTQSRDSDIEFITTNYPKVEYLNIGHNQISNIGISFLGNLQLKSLFMPYTLITDDVLDVFSGRKKLKSLNIDNCKLLTNLSVEKLKLIPKLKNLSINNIKINLSLAEVDGLLDSLKRLKNCRGLLSILPNENNAKLKERYQKISFT